MRILVLGATGRLGPHVVRALLADGRQVRAVCRDAARARDVLPSAAELVVHARTGVAADVVEVTPDQAGQAARAAGATEWESHHLAEMLAMFRSGASEYVTDDVAELTGRTPRSVTDVIRDHRDLFAG